MLSAFYQVITGRAPNLLRAYLLAVLIQMPFVNLLARFDLVQVPIALFYGLATAAAGFLFGLGMVLAVSSFVFIVTAFLGSWFGIRLGWLD